MKKICTILLVLAMLACFLLPVSGTQMQDSSVQNGCNTIEGAVTFLGSEQKIENTQSVILYETTTDTLMYAYNADAQAYPASLVKILTALIAIEQGVLTDAVVVRQDVLDTIPDEATDVDLVPDEVLSVEDLLYCMMVGSANDAAAVLADHVMGSQQAFVDELNRYAQKLGCDSTNFTNVHGLHNDQQYTTARDVCRLLAQAIQNEKFCEIFETVSYTVPATNMSEERNLTSGNYLVNNRSVEIYYDNRVTGSRTGVTTDRTRCVASVAKNGDLTLISVILGSVDTYKDDGYTVKNFGGYRETTALLDMGFNGYKTAQVFFAGQPIQQLNVPNGDSDLVIGPDTSAYSVLPYDADDKTLIYRYGDMKNLTAPIEKGQKISELEVWSGSVCVARADLFALNKVDTAAAINNINSGRGNGIKLGRVIFTILGIVFSVLLLGFAILCVIRGLRIRAAKKRSRRHSKNRRRSW